MADATKPPLTEAVASRLYLARIATTEGRDSAQDPMAFARMRAVLLLDHAAELVVSTLLSVSGAQINDKEHLPGLLDQLLASYPSLGSHREAIRRAHRIRNRVAHDGSVPSPEDARQIAVAVEGFFADALQEVLGIGLESATPISVVADDETRAHLVAAQAALAKDDHRTVIREVAIAVERARIGLKRTTGSREIHDIASGLTSAVTSALHDAGLRGVGGLSGFQRDVGSALSPLIDLVLSLESGISLNEFRWFRTVTPAVSVSTGNPSRVYLGSSPTSPTETKDNAERAMDFALRAVLAFEAHARRMPS